MSMRGFGVFWKKEMTELIRTWRGFLLGAVAVIFGILNPLIAKITPVLFEKYADDFKKQGIIVNKIEVSAKDSWAQFDKNYLMFLIVAVAVFSGSYVTEYTKGTLIPLLTKGLSRTSVVLSKFLVQLMVWTAYFGICFGITWGYTVYFWDNSVMRHYVFMGFCFWLFGVYLIAAMAFFSSFLRSAIQVLLGVGGIYFILSMMGMLKDIAKVLPTYLTGSASLLTGETVPGDYLYATLVATGASCLFVILAVVITRRRKL